MKKLLLSLAAVALASGVGFADVYTMNFDSGKYTATSFTGSQTEAYEDANTEFSADWTLDITKVNTGYYFGKDSTKGMQIGSAAQSAKTVTISSDSFEEYQISSVSVEMSQGGKASFSGTIKVGENSQDVELTTTSAVYELTLDTPVSGEAIVIEMTNSNTATSSNGAFYVKSITINYVAVGDERGEADLAYEETELVASLGESFTAPVLVNPNNLAVEYTSSNEAVATVDEDGNVTLVGRGVTEITASFAGNDEFRKGEATYTLTVVDPNANDATFDFTDLSLSSGDDVTDFASGLITVLFSKESVTNGPKYYINSKGNAVRVYKGNAITVTVEEGYALKSVEFLTQTSNNFTSATTTEDDGDFAVGTGSSVWTPANGEHPASVTFNVGSTVWIQGINVEYEKSTAVEAINAENAEKVVYDLNGRRVNGNLEKGIYVVREGQKTYKLMVK